MYLSFNKCKKLRYTGFTWVTIICGQRKIILSYSLENWTFDSYIIKLSFFITIIHFNITFYLLSSKMKLHATNCSNRYIINHIYTYLTFIEPIIQHNWFHLLSIVYSCIYHQSNIRTRVHIFWQNKSIFLYSDLLFFFFFPKFIIQKQSNRSTRQLTKFLVKYNNDRYPFSHSNTNNSL